MAKVKIGALKLRVWGVHALEAMSLTWSAPEYPSGGTTPAFGVQGGSRLNAGMPAEQFYFDSGTSWTGHAHWAVLAPSESFVPQELTNPTIKNFVNTTGSDTSAATALTSWTNAEANWDKVVAYLATRDWSTLNAGSSRNVKLPPEIASQGPFVGASGTGLDLTVSVPASAILPVYVSCLAEIKRRFGTPAPKHAEGEPQLTRPSSAYKYTRGISVVMDGGPSKADFTAPVYVYMDSTSKTLSYSGQIDTDVGGPLGEAMTARAAYQKQMVQAMADKAAGGAVTLPAPTRPIATAATGLPPEDKVLFDDWWAEMEKARKKLADAPAATPESAFAAYQAAGGTKTQADYLAAIGAAKTAATGTDSTSWLSSLGTGLGLAADKTSSLLGTLTGQATDLLKSWGPMGTVGAYGGVKAVNAAGNGDISKVLLYGGLAAVALLVLK